LQLIIFIILVFLVLLIIEKILLNQWTNSIPLRITVSGTRGKSSVVRLLASILREDGKKVLAKTTGSEAKYILPDGSESDVPRRGIPSILEQKKLMRKAANLHVDCIVAEIMSIHPENHYVESQQLLKPGIVLITNVRFDHIEAIGNTEDEIASVYRLDIPEKATVFISEQEVRSAFLKAIENKDIDLIAVQRGVSSVLLRHGFESKIIEFSENFDLVVSVAKHLGVDQQMIIKGIQKAKQDFGELKIWKYQSRDSGKICYLVNAFAANDPQSTIEIISLVKNKIPFQTENFIGLLNLRSDRGDRTLQWIQALKNGTAHHFTKLFIIGAHTSVVKRKVNSVYIIKDKLPEKIMNGIFAEIEDQAVVFGFGNIGGNGSKLIDYWNQIGEAYGI
jgi:poly-gamma-glutamate synthase PgsB/CapB